MLMAWARHVDVAAQPGFSYPDGQVAQSQSKAARVSRMAYVEINTSPAGSPQASPLTRSDSQQ